MPSLDTLVSDIYKVLDAENDHEPSEDNVQWAGELLKTVLRDRLRVKSDRNPLRFSNLGKPDRQLWYLANAPEKAEKMSPQTYMKFLYGDILELLTLFLAKEAGHSVTHEQHQVSFAGVLGHVDAVIDGVCTDVKSASPYSFQKFKSGSLVFGDDSFGYIPQLGGYTMALERAGVLTEVADNPAAAFIAVDKVSGNICVSPIDKQTVQAHDPEPKIEHQKKIIALTEPPARCYPAIPDGKSGNMRLGTECSYCAFRKECWKDSNDGRGLRTFIYANGPKFLVKTVREPDVLEV